jgi:hypothetical protein
VLGSLTVRGSCATAAKVRGGGLCLIVYRILRLSETIPKLITYAPSDLTVFMASMSISANILTRPWLLALASGSDWHLWLQTGIGLWLLVCHFVLFTVVLDVAALLCLWLCLWLAAPQCANLLPPLSVGSCSLLRCVEPISSSCTYDSCTDR